MDKREQYDLADRKGYNVTQSTTRDYVRLIGLDGNPVKNESGGAAYSYTEATRYLGGAAGSFDIAKSSAGFGGALRSNIRILYLTSADVCTSKQTSYGGQ